MIDQFWEIWRQQAWKDRNKNISFLENESSNTSSSAIAWTSSPSPVVENDRFYAPKLKIALFEAPRLSALNRLEILRSSRPLSLSENWLGSSELA